MKAVEKSQRKGRAREKTFSRLGVENASTDAGRDGRPVSRDQILRRERGHGRVHFPCVADHNKQDWKPYRLLANLLYCCCLHIKNRSDLYPVPFSFLLFKAKKRISVVTR